MIFIVRNMTELLGFQVMPVHPVLLNSDNDIHYVGITVCRVQHVLGVRVRPGKQIVHHFPYNGNPTRSLNTTSLKCCLPSSDPNDRWKKKSCMHMKVHRRLMQARFIQIHHIFTKKKRIILF